MSEKNFEGYISWGILVVTFVTVFFHRLAVGAVADDISSELNISGVVLGNITAMNFYAYALMQIPVGIMVDTIGVRRICTLGALVTAMGAYIFSFMNTVEMAYLSRFLVGLGTSVVMVSIMKIQTIWFPSRYFSALSGITSFIGNMGAYLATAPLTYLAVLWGWRSTFSLMGLVSLVLGIATFIFVRDKERGERQNKLQGNRQRSWAEVKEGLVRVIKNPYSWPSFFLLFTLVGANTAILGLWGIPYISQVYALDKIMAAQKLAYLTFGVIVGAPLVGKAVDLFKGRVKPILLGASLVYTGLWIYITVVAKARPSMESLPILLFFIGLSWICHILAFTNTKEVNPIEYAGMACALTNVGEFIGGSIVSLLVGAVLDLNWSGSQLNGTRIYEAIAYQRAFYIIIVMGLLSIVSVLMMKDGERINNSKISEGVIACMDKKC